MWSLADRVVKAVSDLTVGTMIVLVHVAIADRKKPRAIAPGVRSLIAERPLN